MAIYEGEYFTRPQEVWDTATCEKRAKHTARDGMGTRYPFKGYIGSHYGKTRYNGGFDHDGDWYEGEIVPLPQVAEGFEIVPAPMGGYRIKKL